MLSVENMAQRSVDKDSSNGTSSQRPRTKDVTGRFLRASSSLPTGRLVKEETLSLFDTVQALEIMDPKMDAGFLGPGETLKDQYDIGRDLLPEEVLGIMDQMLCYQMAWHQGYALSQNLFSSLYIDHILSAKRDLGTAPTLCNIETGKQPNELTQVVLLAFCITVIKSCDICIEIVGNQQYYEEEDFNTQTFGRDLLQDFDDFNYFALLENAYIWLARQHEKGLIEKAMSNAMRARLVVNLRMLDSIFPISPDFPILVATKHSSSNSQHLALNLIRKTHSLGKPVPEAFSTKLQRKLACTTPPRPLNELQFEDACSIVEKLRGDLVEAAEVNSLGGDADLEQIQSFLWAFANRDTLALPRAAVQIHLFSEDKRASSGAAGVKYLLWLEIQGLVPNDFLSHRIFDVESPNDQGFKTAQILEQWTGKASSVYIDFLRCLCLNPSRIRRSLSNVLQDVDSLHFHLNEWLMPMMGVESLSDYVASLILMVTKGLQLRIVTAIITLGFQQNLYDIDEVAQLQTCWDMAAIDRYESFSEVTNYTLENLGKLTQLANQTVGQGSTQDQETPNRHPFGTLQVRMAFSSIWCSTIRTVSLLQSVLTRLGAYGPLPEAYYKPGPPATLRMKPFASLTAIPDITGISGENFIVLMTDYDDDTTAMRIRSIGQERDWMKTTGIFEYKQNPQKFYIAWKNACLNTTDAADRHWLREYVKMSQAFIKACIFASTVQEGLKRYGSVAALRGKVKVELPDTEEGALFALPKNVQVV